MQSFRYIALVVQELLPSPSPQLFRASKSPALIGLSSIFLSFSNTNEIIIKFALFFRYVSGCTRGYYFYNSFNQLRYFHLNGCYVSSAGNAMLAITMIAMAIEFFIALTTSIYCCRGCCNGCEGTNPSGKSTFIYKYNYLSLA